MNIFKKEDCFELYPKTKLDCQFIDYIENAELIAVGSEPQVGSEARKTKIGNCYHVRAFIREEPYYLKNKMKKGDLIEKF